MASKKVIYTKNAPEPVAGVYNQAIVANNTVYCSGQVGLDPATGKLVEGDVAARAVQCIKNIRAVLEAAGTSIEHAVKVQVFLTDMKDFNAVNKVYIENIGDPKPSRTCVAVAALPLGTDVEIECIAILP